MAQPATAPTAAPATVDSQRSARALEIQATRALSVVRTPGGRFRAERAGRALDTADYETPAEALEAAEATLTAADARVAELSAATHLANVARAVYAPWPETVRTGPTAGHVEWQVLRVADKSVLSTWGGLTPALVEIGRLLAEDDAARGR